MNPPEGDLLILGFDSMNWYTLLPLMRTGRVPALERTIAQAAHGNLQTLKPTLSDVIWTTILTGRNPDAHGITAVMLPDLATGKSVPSVSSHRRAAALWDILGHHRRASVFVKWLVTWPVEQSLGIQLTQRFRYKELTDRAYPAKYETESVPALPKLWTGPDYSPQTVLHQNRVLRYHLQELVEWAPDDQHTFEWGTYAQGKYYPSVLALFFWGLDRIQHHFFEYTHLIPHDQLAWAEAADVIPSYYRMYDEVLARFIAQALYNNIVILSDHGMQNADDPNKFMIRENKPLGASKLLVRVLSANALLAKLGLLSQTKEGVIDWDQTLVYEQSGRYEQWRRFLVPNIRGISPYGIIEPTLVREQLSDILQVLRAVTDSDNGIPLFSSVTLTDDEVPVIVCQLNPEIHDLARLTLADNHYALAELIDEQIAGSGQHHQAPPGMIILAGAKLQPTRLLTATVRDVTPTILALLQLPQAQDFAGNILGEALKAPSALEVIASYDFLRQKQERSGISAVDEELEERMRQLGYIQ